MMERNHWNTFGQNKVSSMPEEESEVVQITENDSCIGNYGFPRKQTLNENVGYDSSKDFVLPIITRMPDLTGYGHDTAPQGISLHRPKHGRTNIHLEILKKLRKLSLQKWCTILVIVTVTGMIGWSFFQDTDSQQVAQKSSADNSNIRNMPSDNVTTLAPIRSVSSRGVGDFRFDDLNGGASSSQTTNEQVNFFSGISTSPSAQNNLGPQSIVPVDSTTSVVSQYPPGITSVAMVTPDTPSRDLPPWERQPNSTTTVAMANNNSVPYASMAMATPQVTPYHLNSQEVYSQNTLSQNGQFQPVSPQQGFAGMANEYGGGYSQNVPEMTAGTYSHTGMMPYSPQQNQPYNQPPPASVSQQIAGGFGAMTQQVSYHQAPVSHETAIAANTNNMPTYLQGQGQWQSQEQPQQNVGYAQQGYAQQYAPVQNPGDNYRYTTQNQQPSYSGNRSQYVPQGIGPSVPQSGSGMSNVPVMASGQSYRDTAAMETNLFGTTNQYPGNQPQQSIPYNNTAVSHTQNFYH